MKKAGLIIGVALCVFVLGLGIYHTSATEASPEMAEADIEEMVSEQYPGEIASIEKRKEMHNTIYEVKLKNDAKGYTLKVDGDTGEILKIDEKALADADDSDNDNGNDEQPTADSGNNEQKGNQDMNDQDENNAEDNNKDDNENDNNQSEQTEDHSNDVNENQDNDGENNNSEKSKKTDKQTVIDIKEAMAIGLNEYSGTIKEIELDEEDGQLIYEVEIVSGNVKAEIDINAYTGEIIVVGTESTDGIDADVDSFISIEEAMEIALTEFQGTVVQVELEEEDDSYIYEIEIESDNGVKEIEIDVYSGKIVDIDN